MFRHSMQIAHNFYSRPTNGLINIRFITLIRNSLYFRDFNVNKFTIAYYNSIHVALDFW